MHIARSLQEASELQLDLPAILTIGNFDGVHRGHASVLQHVVEVAKKENKHSVVITFANHPSEVLRVTQPTLLLCTLDHKIKLLKEAHIDCVVLITFTKELSEQTAEEFLKTVRHAIPYHTLLLGSDAHIGKNREGDKTRISTLAKSMGFSVTYFPDLNHEGQRISSSRVRQCIEQGRLKDAEMLLGRPYSICGPVLKGHGRGAPLGFPTANISVDKLCLPPLGVYAVTLWDEGKPHDAVANLGNAPTVHQERAPLLEVHLFDQHIDLYGHIVDVQFKTFIRPEKRFDTLETLKAQIAQDIIQAKKFTSLD